MAKTAFAAAQSQIASGSARTPPPAEVPLVRPLGRRRPITRRVEQVSGRACLPTLTQSVTRKGGSGAAGVRLRGSVTVDRANSSALPSGLLGCDGDGEVVDVLDTWCSVVVPPGGNTGPVVVVPLQRLHRANGGPYVVRLVGRDSTGRAVDDADAWSRHPVGPSAWPEHRGSSPGGRQLTTPRPASGRRQCSACLGPSLPVAAKGGVHTAGVTSASAC